MKDFVKILLRFVPPYRKYLLLNIVFNLLAAVLTLFSFALIIPILEMLFQINTATYSFMPLGTASLKEVAVNNFYYYTQESIASMGAASTLALLAAALVVMTALKTGATFLSSYFIVPLRSGIVRDLRNFMYRKITTLSFVHCISSVKSSSLNWSGASLAGFTMLLLTCAWIPPCSRNGSRSSWTGKPIRNC